METNNDLKKNGLFSTSSSDDENDGLVLLDDDDEEFKDTLSKILPPDRSNDVTKASATVSDELSKLKSDPNYVQIGNFVAQGIEEFTSGVMSLKAGDTMGGSAGVLRGIGQFSSMLALIPGGGAIASGILAAVTGLISAILNALKPVGESLESKIEKIVTEAALKALFDDLKGGLAKWELAEIEIHHISFYRLEASKCVESGKTYKGDPLTEKELKACTAFSHGKSWEYLKQNTKWDDHYEKIQNAFSSLSTNEIRSNEWMHLFDLTITYTLRFWMGFEALAGIVSNENDGRGIFRDEKKTIANSFQKNIAKLYEPSLNLVNFYHIWMSPTAWADPYSSGKGGNSWTNSLMKRIGLINPGLDTTDYGSCSTFAVASSGTLFAGGTNGLYVGRSAGNLSKSEDCPGYDQVFICELAEEKILVVCLHDEGHKISWHTYNDATGFGENALEDWTPNKKRWEGTWNTRSIVGVQGKAAGYETILSMSIVNSGQYTRFYAFAVSDSYNGCLFEIAVGNSDSELQMIPIDGYYVNHDILKSATWNIAPGPGRSEISPVTVSHTTLNNSQQLYVQVGNSIYVPDGLGSVVVWDLKSKSFFWDDKLKCYQGRFFEDGSFVCATNKGVLSRFTDFDNNIQVEKEPAVQTEWFWKQVSGQAHTVRELSKQFLKAAPKE